jgi:predicted helicase
MPKTVLRMLVILCAWRDFSPFGLLPGRKAILRHDIWQKSAINPDNSHEVDHWKRRGNNSVTIDDFIDYNGTQIKWSEGLKLELKRSRYVEFSDKKVRPALYRPFCKQWLFFEHTIIERTYQYPQILPISANEAENRIICLTDILTIRGFQKR